MDNMLKFYLYLISISYILYILYYQQVFQLFGHIFHKIYLPELK